MALPRPAKAPPLYLLPRERLTAQFARAASARVVLCVAPAGHGKTVALEQFLEHQTTRAVRIVPGEPFGGLFAFVRELAAQLSGVLDRSELSFSAVYDRVAASASPEVDLARWLRSQLPQHELCIIVDNLERAAADGPTVRFIDLMIRETPCLKWYLLTRSAGALAVPNWMADGLMDLPIDRESLAFDADEVRELAGRYDATLSPEQLDALGLELCGWPLGVSARLRYRNVFEGVAFDRGNAGACHRILLERCFQICSERERDLLLDTALMHRLHPQALHVLGWKSGLRVLSRLCARFPHFFNGREDVLAYDDLTRAYLVDLLKERGAQAYISAVERCGYALEQAGSPAEALSLYVECGSAVAIGALLERHGFPLLDGGFADLVNAALRALPAESGAARPVTLALRGSYEASLGRNDVAEAWFVHALKLSNGEIHDEIAYRHACHVLRWQRPDSIELLEELASRTEDPEMLANARSALAQAYFLEDRVDDARRCIRDAVAGLDEISNEEVVARTLGRAAYVSLYSEDLKKAEEFGRRALDLAIASRQYVVAVGALSVLYSVASERGLVDEALEHILQLGEYSTYTGNLDFQLYALAGSYELYAERYDLAGIARCESALTSFELHYDTNTTLEALLPARALQRAWRGEFDRAYALLAPSASQQRGADWKAQRHAELALYAAACGRETDAAAHLHSAEEALRECVPGTHAWAQAHLFVALAYSLTGKAAEAERCVEAARGAAVLHERMSKLAATVRELHRWLNSAGNHAALYASFENLYAVQLGGFSRMLEQIPLPARTPEVRLAG